MMVTKISGIAARISTGAKTVQSHLTQLRIAPSKRRKRIIAHARICIYYLEPELSQCSCLARMPQSGVEFEHLYLY